MVRAAGRGLVGAWGVLRLRPHGSRYALAARASPSWFALLARGLGFALTTIIWIHLLQLNGFIYFALQNLWIHLQNLWLHILTDFISKWIHLSKKKTNKNAPLEVEPCSNYHYTLCHTTINLHNAGFFYNICTNFVHDSHEWENDFTNYYRWIHLCFCSRQQKKHMNNIKLK